MFIFYFLSSASFFFITLSLIFIFIALIGIIRMNVLYNKAHASGIIDSFALPLLCIGIALLQHSFLISFKMIMLSFFLITTSVVTTHALCSIYYQTKLTDQNNRNE